MAIEKKLDCVILGLLSTEELTGYEIKKCMSSVIKYFWSASYGSIYQTLNQLVENEYATKREAIENGRTKIIYRITEKGREYLRVWLSIPAEKNELRFETILKLFFGGSADKSISLRHLEDFKQRTVDELPIIEKYVEDLDKIKHESPTNMNYLLIALFGMKIFNTYLEWCEESEKLLKDYND